MTLPVATEGDIPRVRSATHVRALDGLRGVAIVLVLLRHVGQDTPARHLGGVVIAAFNTGWLGVDVFFVLSGFLITGILLDARGDAAQPSDGYFLHFYARRALRIFPAYYLFLIATFFIGRPPMPYGTWWYWTYLTNVGFVLHDGPKGVWGTGHLWSLAVEEQFYLVWPAIIAWTPRRRLPAVCLAVILAAIALRVTLILQGAVDAANVLTPPRADTLAAGALLAIALRSGPRTREAVARAAPAVGAVAIGALLVLFVTRQLVHITWIGGLVLGSVAMTLLVTACIARIQSGGGGGWIRRALEWGPLVSFGTYSYAIYLVQMPLRGSIDYWLGARLATHPALGVAAETVLLSASAWCIAWLSWRLVERPILSLKRYVPMPRPVTADPIPSFDMRRPTRTSSPRTAR
jgi:peptidoglycan/LPS O-acetylase OafA/YrhL